MLVTFDDGSFSDVTKLAGFGTTTVTIVLAETTSASQRASAFTKPFTHHSFPRGAWSAETSLRDPGDRYAYQPRALAVNHSSGRHATGEIAADTAALREGWNSRCRHRIGYAFRSRAGPAWERTLKVAVGGR
jgi:hypothetical protein